MTESDLPVRSAEPSVKFSEGKSEGEILSFAIQFGHKSAKESQGLTLPMTLKQLFALINVALLSMTIHGCMRPKDKPQKQTDSTIAAPQQPEKTASPPVLPTPEPISNVHKSRELDGIGITRLIQQTGAKATLLNIWASWCGPCKREFPMLVKLKRKWKNQGVELLFVSVDEKSQFKKAQLFAAEHGLSDELFFAARPLGPFKAAVNPEWPGMLPASFLYDQEGRLRYFWGGPVYEKELTPIIDGLLAGEPIDGQQLYGLAPGAHQ